MAGGTHKLDAKDIQAIDIKAIDIEMIDIEAIVREVTARLSAHQAPLPDSSNSKQVVIRHRVVTLAEVEGQLNGATQVVVPKAAVVTPAVKDLLRHAGVALTYATEAGVNGASKHRLSIGVAETMYDPSPLVRAVYDRFAVVEQLARTGLVTVVDELTAEVARGGNLGLLFTGHLATAACLANRQRGVRAATAASTSEVVAAVDELGGNLLIVDPAQKSLSLLKQMVTAFASSGTRNCPPNLVSRLE